MIRPFLNALNKPLFSNKISIFRPLILSHPFSSSLPHQTLKSSPFAKQLGLQQQYRHIVKLQKQNESSKLRMSALIVGLVIVTCGTAAIVYLIDDNRAKLVMYQVNKWKGEIGWGGKDYYQKKEQKDHQEKQHQKNLREMFDKNFKDRSVIDGKFLRYVGEYVEDRIKEVKLNKNEGKLNLTDDILYILQNLVEKIQTASQQKSVHSKLKVLQIVEKIIHFELTNQYMDKNTAESIANSSLKSDPKQQISHQLINLQQKMSKFLLTKGDLNQQLLGLKYLQVLKIPQSLPISSYFSSQQLTQIRQNLNLNKQHYDKSLIANNHVQTQEQVNELSRRIVKVKETLLYSMDQLKQVNDIKKAKLDYLEDVFRQEIRNDKNKKRK